MMDTVMIEDLQLEDQTNDENSKTLRERIIDHIVLKALNSDFNSQQNDQSEFSLEERKTIAEDILNNSHSKFLYIFGEYLIEEHLEYFKSENYNNYEIHFHLHRLSRLINSKKVISRNRRYQAMQELLKSDYFSDNEMRNREPLLWEQLVGKYLSEEEKFTYDNQYLAQNSLTEVLFEQIDRDNRDNLKRKQQIEEVQEVEEEKVEEDDNIDVDDDDNDDDDFKSDQQSVAKPSSFWGEYSKPKNKTVKIGKRRWKEDHYLNLDQCNTKELNEKERLLLLSEFKSHMINKFLNGQEDYDYNNVDNNPEFDNLEIEAIDEEEKYFDLEIPSEGIPISDDEEIEVEERPKEIDDDEEDELDTYMNMLEKNEITDIVTNKLKNL